MQKKDTEDGINEIKNHILGTGSRLKSSEFSFTSSSNISGTIHDISDVEGQEVALDASANRAQNNTKSQVRKRKRANADNLESQYMEKISKDIEKNYQAQKKQKQKSLPREDGHDRSSENDLSLLRENPVEDSTAIDLSKDEATRTVYLANVSTEAVTSKRANKSLCTYLRSVLENETDVGWHLEKLRFRSLPVSSTKIPKRASYITKSLLESTTKAIQAYAVYSSQAAARSAVKKLNGTVVLGRHLRADLTAHPDEKDHRRCVYIGNLNFVDDENSMMVNANADQKPSKKLKIPSDVEEGLWRIFTEKAGPVEFVRVPRDPNTRVGKGFAYVQFKDGISVEKALLLNGCKFPPMLPRELRVTRCKNPKKTARSLEREKLKVLTAVSKSAKSVQNQPKAMPESRSGVGRAVKLLGKGGAALIRRNAKEKGEGRRNSHVFISEESTATIPEQIVFEGRRASEKDGRPAGIKFGKDKHKVGSGRMKRSNRRAAEWKKTKVRS